MHAVSNEVTNVWFSTTSIRWDQVDYALSKRAEPPESESADVWWHLVVYKTGAIYCDRDDQRNNVSDESCHVYRLVTSTYDDPRRRTSWKDVHVVETLNMDEIAQKCWTHFEVHQKFDEVPW